MYEMVYYNDSPFFYMIIYCIYFYTIFKGYISIYSYNKILSIIPHVAQYIIVAYVTLNSLYLPVFHSKFPLPHFSPLVITSLISKSTNLLLLCYIH